MLNILTMCAHTCKHTHTHTHTLIQRTGGNQGMMDMSVAMVVVMVSSEFYKLIKLFILNM